MTIELRPVRDEDLDVFYEHQADPEWAAMAVFESRDRESFFAHQRRLFANPQIVNRAVLADGEVCGRIGSWIDDDGRRLVGYGYGRQFWGRGIASEALRLYLAELTVRPLYAFVALSNLGSIRVLEKAGFTPVGEPHVGDDGVGEQLYRLD